MTKYKIGDFNGGHGNLEFEYLNKSIAIIRVRLGKVVVPKRGGIDGEVYSLAPSSSTTVTGAGLPLGSIEIFGE